MRAGRWFVTGAVLGGLVALPGTAAANGGAYISLDRTHYLPGETARAVVQVSIPERKQDLLGRGPFYAFLLPNGVSLGEGRPIPDGAIRVATFAVEEGRRDAFELTATFTVPDLRGAYYTVALCNDPCTLRGFGEPLFGDISVVATEREAELLTANSRLEGRVFGLRRQLRKAERRLEDAEGQLSLSSSERAQLAQQVTELEGELAAASEPTDPRPVIEGWAAALVAFALLVLAAAILWRRRRRDEPAVAEAGTSPDTLAA